MAPPHTFLLAVLETEDATELAEMELLEALLDSELATDVEAESMMLLNEDIELETEVEITEAADLMLSDACSTTPGFSPATEDETFADKLLALAPTTETTLSALP
jgi:uncharacterized protein (AIM24 family)